MKIRKFLVTTVKSPEGVIFGYNRENEALMMVQINQDNCDPETVKNIFANVFLMMQDFISWCKRQKGLECVELLENITFDMFWDKYNDKERSSKKRSRKIWDKLPPADQAKAFYYYDQYNRNRGNAEKKYCETYLAAEMWNN